MPVLNVSPCCSHDSLIVLSLTLGGRAIDTIPPAKGRDLGVVGTTKHKKRLRKAFDRVAKRLMDVEQEAPHRIRCIYQWADKEHQGGGFDAR